MKIGIIIVALVLCILIVFVIKAVQSQQAPALGLVAGKLRPCPNKPNCVSSEADHTDTLHDIAPLPLQPSAWQTLLDAIEKMGGTIEFHDDVYVHATFRSHLFRYVDDMEAYIDNEEKLIQWRSASRVGHSDFGVNRARIEALRQTILRAMGKDQ